MSSYTLQFSFLRGAASLCCANAQTIVNKFIYKIIFFRDYFSKSLIPLNKGWPDQEQQPVVMSVNWHMPYVPGLGI